VNLTKRKDILNLETRKKIYQFIQINPGLHLSEISKKLGISQAAVSHFETNALKKIKEADEALKVAKKLGIKP